MILFIVLCWIALVASCFSLMAWLITIALGAFGIIVSFWQAFAIWALIAFVLNILSAMFGSKEKANGKS